MMNKLLDIEHESYKNILQPNKSRELRDPGCGLSLFAFVLTKSPSSHWLVILVSVPV